MTSIYYVKVYVEKVGQTQPEIRRFPIDISPERDTFADLNGKVAALVLSQQQKAFSLQYLDEDNERITFSTDDELRMAITLNKDGNVLKVYAIVQPNAMEINGQQQTTTTTTSGNAEHHPGITCDVCSGKIIGFRFKCLVCPDYDLCEKCSAMGKHPEHNMIKITKPGSFHLPSGPHFPPPPPHHGHGHPPPPPHHLAHHFHHHRRHGHGNRSPHHHGRFPPLVPNPDLLQQIQSQIPQWLPKPEQMVHAQAHMKQHLDALKTTAQGHVQNSKEYLQTVGQMLQKALSPLGIDCDYHVDETPSTATATGTTTTSSSSSTTTTTTNSNDVEKKEEEKPAEVTTTAAAASASPLSSSSSTASLVEVTPDDLVVIGDEEINQGKEEGAIPIIEDLTPEQAIQVCLEKLVAMGFPSNNSHLTELVRSKRGDINAVLDALNTRQ